MSKAIPPNPTNRPPPADALTRALSLQRLVGEELQRMVTEGDVRPLVMADVTAAMARLVKAAGRK